MALVTVTFVRHGESTDNLKTVWAGWADASLSNHGMNVCMHYTPHISRMAINTKAHLSKQARAAGDFFASTNTHFTAIYTSDLKRAYTTAQAILNAQPEPKPSFKVSKDLREQHFGVAEGRPWSLKGVENLSREEQYARGIYPVIYNRKDKLPDGESLNDLQARAERAMEEIVMPHVWNAAKTGEKAHIAIVSHGLCVSELIAALVRKDRDVQARAQGGKWTGLMNTAWTRVTIDLVGLKEGDMVEADESDPPPLMVKVTDVNQHSHLDKLKRQQGGIGSSAYDPAQKDIRAFFGGASLSPKETKNNVSGKSPPVELEEGRAASNAFDELVISTEGNGTV
ncbi:hypothetical protein ACEPAG_1505 [Sanghuangporus baumii]